MNHKLLNSLADVIVGCAKYTVIFAIFCFIDTRVYFEYEEKDKFYLIILAVIIISLVIRDKVISPSRDSALHQLLTHSTSKSRKKINILVFASCIILSSWIAKLFFLDISVFDSKFIPNTHLIGYPLLLISYPLTLITSIFVIILPLRKISNLITNGSN